MTLSTTYRGLDRQGTSVVGEVTGGSPYDFVSRAYSLGWRSLTVQRGGVEVGQIERTRNGRRVWWVVSEDPQGSA